LPAREVHCADALEWMRQHRLPSGAVVFTSLPDVSELRGMDLPQWRDWFTAAAEAVLRATPADGAAVFYQSDIREGGVWIDKSFLVQQAAQRVGTDLLWHRIVCRAPVGTATGGRPGYVHLLCFGRRGLAADADGFPDVLPEMGEMTWRRGTGLLACEAVVQWARSALRATVVCDPFCGEGAVLAVANRAGLDAIGVDRSPVRAERARELVV
jgi:hypothetical protein